MLLQARAVPARHRGGHRRRRAGTAWRSRSTARSHRLDLNDVHARLARDRGVPLVISSDAHSRHALGVLRWGVVVARRAWLEPGHVLNTLLDELKWSCDGTADDAPRRCCRRTTSTPKSAPVLQDDAADDSAGSGEGARPAEVDGARRNASARPSTWKGWRRCKNWTRRRREEVERKREEVAVLQTPATVARGLVNPS